MELEKKVCGLALAMRLKELGVKQESAYAWWKQRRRWKLWYCGNKFPGHAAYSAFDVAELGEMLPRSTLFFRFGETDADERGGWECLCYPMFSAAPKLPEELYKTSTFFQAKAEADARAKMLIYLLENNLIKREAK